MLTIIVSPQAVFLGDRLIVELSDGRVARHHTEGNPYAPTIIPLVESLSAELDYLELVAEKTGRPYYPVVQVIIDPTMCYQTVIEVLQTAQNSGMKEARVFVTDSWAKVEEGELDTMGMLTVLSNRRPSSLSIRATPDEPLLNEVIFTW